MLSNVSRQATKNQVGNEVDMREGSEIGRLTADKEQKIDDYGLYPDKHIAGTGEI